VRVFYGFIFINMSDEEPVDFDASFGDLAPYLDFHGFADAKIAFSRSYPTDGELETRGREFRRVLSLRTGASGVLFHASAGGADRFRRGTELRARRRGGKISAGRARLGEARRDPRASARHRR
jgi:hypothetical protein